MTFSEQRVSNPANGLCSVGSEGIVVPHGISLLNNLDACMGANRWLIKFATDELIAMKTHLTGPHNSDRSPKFNLWLAFARILWILDRLHLDHTHFASWDSPLLWLPSKQVQPAANDPLFSRIAGLANVPPANRDRLQQCISLELERVWGYLDNPSVYGPWYLQIAHLQIFPPENRELEARNDNPKTLIDQKALRSARRQIGELKRSSTELSVCLSGLNLYALGSLAYANDYSVAKPLMPGGDDFPKIKAAIAMLEQRASVAEELLRPEKLERPVGRPNRGGFGNLFGPGSFQAFVIRLLWDVGTVGGELTLDKNRRTGTLVDALDFLSPHLPAGFVPNALPLATLSAIKALAKKLAAGFPTDEVLKMFNAFPDEKFE